MKTKEYILLSIVIFLLASNIFTLWFGYKKISAIEQYISNDTLNNDYDSQHRPMHPRPKRLKKIILKELDLTDRQRDSFLVLNKQFIEGMKRLHDSLILYRRSYDLELEKIYPNYEAMAFYSQKIGFFVGEIRKNILFYHQGIYEMLTAKQRKKLAEIFKGLNQRNRYKQK